MSIIKELLTDDFTNEPTLEPITVDEPAPEDVYMVELERLCSLFSKHIPFGYENELEGAIHALERILEQVRKPF